MILGFIKTFIMSKYFADEIMICNRYFDKGDFWFYKNFYNKEQIFYENRVVWRELLLVMNKMS